MGTEKWIVEPETEENLQRAVWASVKSLSGIIHAAVVFDAGTDTAGKILSSGMFYLNGPEIPGRTLFRIEGVRRARIAGCMFVKAVEAADALRSRENFVLRELNRILDMEVIQRRGPMFPCDISHGEAS